jgi:hypothetical protein
MIERIMRCSAVKFLLLVVLFTGCAWAENPYVGTWTMNVAECRYPAGTAPQAMMAVITDTGADLDHTITGVAANGNRISARIIIPKTSGEGRVLEGPNYDAVSVKWFSPGEREITYTNHGKVVNTVHSNISPDGKHMQTDSHSVNARGDTIQAHAVYDRQD